MPNTCRVCRHPERVAIDRDLSRHVPLRDIAGQRHLSKSALHRHLKGCKPEEQPKEQQPGVRKASSREIMRIARRLEELASEHQIAELSALAANLRFAHTGDNLGFLIDKTRFAIQPVPRRRPTTATPKSKPSKPEPVIETTGRVVDETTGRLADQTKPRN